MTFCSHALPSCPLCAEPIRQVLRKERNVSCGDYFGGQRLYPPDLGPVTLEECIACGFAWFRELLSWTPQEFKERIYNDQYSLCDPPFQYERPAKISRWLAPALRGLSVLDYGGGEGTLARLLDEQGIDACSYDPFYGHTEWPQRPFDLVTAFEVLEHVPDQRQLVRHLFQAAAPDGLLLFSTLLKPPRLASDWWYASPRNGHIAFHTTESLTALFRELGASVVSLSAELHLAVQHPQALARLPLSVLRPLPINDTPQFFYIDPWQKLAPVPRSL